MDDNRMVLNYNSKHSYREKVRVMEIEWITTREAKSILKVTSTQGVWNVIERAQRQHGIVITRRNIGTSDKPRYLLSKTDVEIVAKAMGKL